MAEILTPTKALAVNPLKTSQPIGASLAFLGLANSMRLHVFQQTFLHAPFP
jgi:nitrogenase molybdenum-iron protein NifN